METLKIQQLKANRELALAPYYEISDDRMRRYFDCQDDSIFGGISDQVTSDTIRTIKQKYDILIEQEMNGGFLLRSAQKDCLYKDGELVSDKIGDGKFGSFFILANGTFVSCAKKKATFDKKGFEVKRVFTQYKCQYSHVTQKGYFIYKNIEVVSIEVKEFDFENDRMGFSKDWLGYLMENQ